MKTYIILLGSACISLLALTASAQKNKKNAPAYIDRSNMDLTVKPGDDFYKYANGMWIKNNPVPAAQTRWSSFNVLAEQNEQRLKGLAESALKNTGDDAVSGRVGRFYKSYMDSLAIEKEGYAPIKEALSKIAVITTKQEALQKIAALRAHGLGSPLFGFFVYPDSKNTTEYITRLLQGGTTLPDRDNYLKDDARSQRIQEALKSYMQDLFRLTGDDAATAQEKALAVYDMEKALATLQMSRVELRDPVKTYNKMATKDLRSLTPGWDWVGLLSEMKVHDADSVLINNPEFFKGVAALYTVLPLGTIKHYIAWNVLKTAAPYLSSPFVKSNFEFQSALTGQKEMQPRWQRASRLTDQMLGELIGQLYVRKYFNEDAKHRMLDLVSNLQETFAHRIQKLAWMSDETKEKALEKLHAIVNKIAYPERWKTYDGVVITDDHLYQNMQNISTYQYDYMVNRLGKPVDRTEWGMSPPTINAYYSPLNNEIVFPAGILQFPFFDFGADDAVNYGGIGAVIGHEFTHGFDDQGRKYAADGNLHNWWTDEDALRFDTLAQKVVAQYAAFTVNDSLHLNGRLTLGENLADLGGLAIAYEAFKNTPAGKSTKKIDGFTPDQRFFLSWAQIWRMNVLPEEAAQRVLTDPHAPGKYRVNGVVPNMDEWYQAFDIQPGDALYKPQNERIRVW